MNDLLDAVAAGDTARAYAIAAARPDLRRERGADGLLPATRVLYARGRGEAQRLLPADSDLNVFEAAAFGRTEGLAEILDADPAEANRLSPDGFTPVHLACFAGGAGTTRLLISRGAQLETLSTSAFARVRPLGTAAFSGDLESARVLLEAGADPNGRGEGGFTPLHSAAQNGNAELVRLLVAHGADATDAGPGEHTPAALAHAAGHEDVARLLESA